MEPTWTLPELVAEVATRIAALPAPKNGQVRAVPDDRTVRYYAAIGLLDRPSAMRGRTALYGRKHVAQVVAIKRLQTAGRSLSDIQTLWPTLDDRTLARMSGVELEMKAKPPARASFWKRGPRAGDGEPRSGVAVQVIDTGDTADTGEPVPQDGSTPSAALRSEPASPPAASMPMVDASPLLASVELRIELAPHVVLSLAMVDGVAMSPADVRAVRAAAAPLLAELARRRLASLPGQ